MMKKISFYLIFIVVIGGLIVSFWIYQKYFKTEKEELLLFKVERGDIREIVRVRGEVASQKEFNLEFPFSGTVEEIFVEEGQEVNKRDRLIKLETTDLELENKELQAQLAQAKKNLESAQLSLEKLKLEYSQQLRGDVLNKNYESGLVVLAGLYGESASILDALDQIFFGTDLSASLPGAKNNIEYYASYNSEFKDIPNRLQESYQEAKDLHQKALIDYEAAKRGAGEERKGAIQSGYEFAVKLAETVKTGRDVIRSFQNSLIVSSAVHIKQEIINTQTADLDAYTSAVNGYLKDLLAIINAINSQRDILETYPLDISFQELKVKQIEDNIKSIETQIAKIQEKISKFVLYAPASGKITKIWLEEKEVFRPGQPAISLSAYGYKIQADVSELEIRKVREVDGNEVLIRLDAFPGQEFQGKVVSIEPREIIKEGDKYYRINVILEKTGEMIRSGMSADLIIKVSSKDNVLKIPEIAVYERNDKKYTRILEGDLQQEVEIETGISDGESIEVTKGLNEGETIVVPAD